jgi:exodeoxyribonuclease VII large subunit
MSQPSFDLDDFGEPTYTVRELTDAINRVLQRGFFDGVWVRGEIEGLQQRGGHVYFTLAEHDGDRRATVPVALFANTVVRLRPLLAKHRLRLRDGLTVRLHGRLDVYAPTGRLSLLVDGLDPTFTLGQLAADRDQLLRKLVARRLFDRNRSLQVPVAPLRVGIVTSRSSAAWHDFTHELDRSGLPFRLVHVDVRVQGDTAAREIAAAIITLARRRVDVIVVVRGGGARSDLATFDAEPIALAIATSPVPVLTGLGHEIDRSVADEVAHTALKTPTACAVHLVECVRAARLRADEAWAAIARLSARRLDRADARTSRTASAIASRTRAAHGLAAHRLASLDAQLRRDVPRAIGLADERLERIEGHVRALDPARVLARGWSITRRSDGSTVRDARELQPGEEVITTFAHGSARSRVEEVTS